MAFKKGDEEIPADIITGDWFYNRLAGQHRNNDSPFKESDMQDGDTSAKAASVWLLENGIDGIRYPQGYMSETGEV